MKYVYRNELGDIVTSEVTPWHNEDIGVDMFTLELTDSKGFAMFMICTNIEAGALYTLLGKALRKEG